MKGKQGFIALLLFVGLATGVYFLFRHLGRPPETAGMQAPPPVVRVAKPTVQTVINDLEFTGTTMAMEAVEIRARVEGSLTKICFQDGADVTRGTPLFEIEPELYQARQAQAQANVTSGESALTRAESDLQRIQAAVKTNAVSQQQVTTALAARDQASAALLAAKAALQEADLNLAYTKIASPIEGRISRRYVDQGNLVGAGENTLLAEVVRLDPLYVTFYVSEAILLGQLPQAGDDPAQGRRMYAGLENEAGFPRAGFLNYVGNRVDASTGTVMVRGQLPNPDGTLLPGMFVRIRIPVGADADAILVEERALGTDIGGKFVLVVDANDVVQRRPVQIGRQVDDRRVITSGISAENAYIVQGLQFAFPGAKVNPQPADTPPPSGASSTTPGDRTGQAARQEPSS